jgi:hypothetical protein
MRNKYHRAIRRNNLFFIAASFILNGCFTARHPGEGTDSRPVYPIRNTQNVEDTRMESFIRYPRPSEFSICHGHTCRYFAHIGLSPAEWTNIESIFQKQADSPIQERENIRDAIAMFETIVGKRSGTANDLGETIEGIGNPGQMDCVDEATNTTVYLTMLQNGNLFHWHTVEHRASRGIMSFQVPHFTAVIRDNESGVKYAVDSWFLDNGQFPFIIPIDEWQAGWKP